MSTGFREAEAILKARLAAAWPALRPDVPVRWPNEKFTRPAANAPWVSCEVHGTTNLLAGIGGGPGDNLWRQEGFVLAAAYVKADSGTATALDIAADLAGVFQGYAAADLRCRGADVDGGAAVQEEGNWFKVTVSVPFLFHYFA
jgi:hypothetical protein